MYDDKQSHQRGHNNFINTEYDKRYNHAMTDPVSFWDEKGKQIHWFKPYTQVLDDSRPHFPRWFVDGETNICYNALDKNVNEGRGNEPALHCVSGYTGIHHTITYAQLLDKVGRLASVLQKKFRIQKGDRVVIYMPMVPEAAMAMLACARIGAIHSLVFGGFAAGELSNRIDNSGAKLVITASKGLEPTKQVDYISIVKEALGLCTKVKDAPSIPKLFLNREELDGKLAAPRELLDSTFYDFNEALAAENEVAPCVSLPANHPLYILYTSGTTGDPKGVVRDHGGTTVALNYALHDTYNYQAGKVKFCAADLGWIAGHTMIIYGPQIRSMASVLFEGKPFLPDPGMMWSLCERYKVDHLLTAPTTVRELIKQDNAGNFVKKYDLSNLGIVQVAGERCDVDTMNWLRRHLPNVVLNDTWWQTESGWPIGSNMLNQDVYGPVFPTLPGSITKVSPGWNLHVLDEDNQPCERGVLGKVCLKTPMPPSHTMTLWGNDEGYIEKYMSDSPGYYSMGDEGMIDERGYLHILSRIDDVINVAGHRLDTGRLEESINKHAEIVESAVIGLDDKQKGQVPLAFVVLRNSEENASLSDEQKQLYVNQANSTVRSDIGALARLEAVIFVQRLPKTRSGKILRRILKSIINEKDYKFPATIDDASTLDSFHQISRSKGFDDVVFRPDQRFKQ